MTTSTPTESFTVIRFSGPDATTFLQGQITQDVRQLEQQPAALAASCDPKGRVLATLTLVAGAAADTLMVVLRGDLAETWLAHVLRYRLRAKVEATVEPNLAIVPGSPDGAEVRWSVAGCDEALVEHAPTNDTVLRRARLAAGIVDVAPFAAARYTPHMLGLNAVNAISFSKGCYTGQEVVARTEHLGRAKRVAQTFRAEHAVAESDEQAVLRDGTRVTDIIAAADDLVVAVINPEQRDGLTLADGSSLTPLS
ncbi:MAG: hypothetical protein AAGF46_07100 [Pseudomonadota bacterium]